jgi:hypothetical protein
VGAAGNDRASSAKTNGSDTVPPAGDASPTLLVRTNGARPKEPKKAGHFFGPHLDNPGVTSSDSSPDAWGPRLAILDFDGSAEGWGRLTILDGRSNQKKVGRIFWRRADNSGVQKEKLREGRKGRGPFRFASPRRQVEAKRSPDQEVRPSCAQVAEKVGEDP